MKAETGNRAIQLKVVIDTNVWISGLLTKTGIPAWLVRQALRQGLPVFSSATFAELQTRLWRPKFDRYISMEYRQQLLHDINAVAYWVDVPPELAAQTFSRDPDDDKFIHTALAAQVPWLVTGDGDLLDLQGSPLLTGLRILKPSDAAQLPEFIGM